MTFDASIKRSRRSAKPAPNKYQAKKRAQLPPKPFEPGESFLDFVDLLDSLCLTPYQRKGA
jgi:hypothetical protein